MDKYGQLKNEWSSFCGTLDLNYVTTGSTQNRIEWEGGRMFSGDAHFRLYFPTRGKWATGKFISLRIGRRIGLLVGRRIGVLLGRRISLGKKGLHYREYHFLPLHLGGEHRFHLVEDSIWNNPLSIGSVLLNF